MQYILKKPSEKTLVSFALLFIIVTGVLIRYSYNEVTALDNPIRGDAGYYFVYAQNLIDHSIFSKDFTSDPPKPDSFWSPGFPAFLYGVIKIANHFTANIYSTLLYAQLIMGTFIIILTFLLAREAISPVTALIPAALVAYSPHLISMGAYALTEILCCFMLLLSMTLACVGVRTHSKLLFLYSGLSFGLTYLVNPVTVFAGPITAFLLTSQLLLSSSQEQKTAGQNIVLIAIVPLLLIISIWGIRNQIAVSDDQPSSSSRLMMNLTAGLHPEYHDRWRKNPRDPNNPATVDQSIIKGSYIKFIQLALEDFKDNPSRMLSWYLLDKPKLLWDWDIRIGQGDIYVYPVFYSLYHVSKTALASYTIMRSLHPWLVASALLAGIFIWRERKRSPTPTVLAIYISTLYITAVYVLTQSEPRYSIPFRPELYICATYFLVSLYRALQSARTQQV